MTLSAETGILMAGYVFFVLCMNCMTYLISAFYEKKFEQRSPKFGYMWTLFAGFVLIGTLLGGQRASASAAVDLIQTCALVSGAAASLWNSWSLYRTMRKVGK